MTTTDLVTTDPTIEESVALVPITPTMPTTAIPSIDELNVMKAIAVQVVKATGMVPAWIKTPEQAFAIQLAGWELGLRPMTALRHMFAVNGKTEPDAQIMAGCVLAGEPNATFIWHKTSAQECDVELRRPGRAPIRMAYKISDVKHLATKAGPWSTYPADMLRWFTLKRVCRLGAPDLINAIEGVGMNINTAESMYDHLPAIEAPEIEGTAIDVTDLHNAGDDPATVPAAAVEAEAAAIEEQGELEVVEMSREEFETWCAAQSPVIAKTHLPGLLGMAKDDAEDPFRRHWIEPGMARGLTMDETIAVARNVIAYMWPLCKAARSAGSKTPVRDVSTETNPFSWLELRAVEKKQAALTPTDDVPMNMEGEGEREAEVGAAPEESGGGSEEEGSV